MNWPQFIILCLLFIGVAVFEADDEDTVRHILDKIENAK